MASAWLHKEPLPIIDGSDSCIRVPITKTAFCRKEFSSSQLLLIKITDCQLEHSLRKWYYSYSYNSLRHICHALEGDSAHVLSVSHIAIRRYHCMPFLPVASIIGYATYKNYQQGVKKGGRRGRKKQKSIDACHLSSLEEKWYINIHNEWIYLQRCISKITTGSRGWIVEAVENLVYNSSSFLSLLW